MEVRKIKRPLPRETVIAAISGKEDAMSQVALHYRAYIRKLSMIEVWGRDGLKRTVVDEELESILTNHLLEAILKFKV